MTLLLLLLSTASAGVKRDVRDAEEAVRTGDFGIAHRLATRAVASGRLPPAWEARALLARAEADATRETEPAAVLGAVEDYRRALSLEPELPAAGVQTVLANALLARAREASPEVRPALLEALVGVRDDVPARALLCDAAPPERVEAACGAVLEAAERAERPEPGFARAAQRLVLQQLTSGDPSRATETLDRSHALLDTWRARVEAAGPDEEAELLGPALDRAAATLELARLTVDLKDPARAGDALAAL
ncbi:MAG: hypothetical protein KC656_07555, partial [Myxococcales bacterium]|nr:hypothetical protein [Myxococcales bacterium]